MTKNLLTVLISIIILLSPFQAKALVSDEDFGKDFSIIINMGDSVTTNPNVKLMFNVSEEITQMKLSHTTSFAGTTMESIKAVKSWHLCNDPRTNYDSDADCSQRVYKVYGIFMDKLGKISPIAKGTITYRRPIEKEFKPAAARKENRMLLTKEYKLGESNEEIKELQKFLNGRGFLVAQSGEPGSIGNETNIFGPATRRAVKTFQEANFDEILKPAGLSQGTGILGPITRMYINQFLSGGRTEFDPEKPKREEEAKKQEEEAKEKAEEAALKAWEAKYPEECIITETLRAGSKGDEVVKLQRLLARDPKIYPTGLVSGTFGTATKLAVGKFQIKHGFIKYSNDQAFGIVGPETRTKLTEEYCDDTRKMQINKERAKTQVEKVKDVLAEKQELRKLIEEFNERIKELKEKIQKLEIDINSVFD